MKKTFPNISIIILIFVAGIYLISSVHIPYCTNLHKKILNVYEQYTVSKNSQNIDKELEKVKQDIHVVDSLISVQISREREIKTGIVEALYTFADSSYLKPVKVEIGEKMLAGSRLETAISVSGTGNYASMGRFVELIENYPRSTRIRQIVLNGTEKKTVEGFIDFILME
jgi:Tfp pilus assembly protein PilO